MIYLFPFYFAVLLSHLTEGTVTELEVIPEPINEYILCRSCGTEVSDSHYLFEKSSPEAKVAFNETIFQKERVLIQILENSFLIKFPVITATRAACEGIAEWQWGDAWFPGYLWKPCICPKCGAHLGWAFEPDDDSATSSEPFFALVLEKLIGQLTTDSLIKFPNFD